MDGARLWNAAAAGGVSERELAEPFDTVSVCFSKGLGGPVGSALAGPAGFIREARRARKLFGGAMRQAGIVAAGALHAVRHHRERLPEDHHAARRLGEAIEECAPFSIRGGQIDTNIVIFEIDPSWGTATSLRDSLHARGILCMAVGGQAVRLVTHLDVTSEQIDEACGAIREIAAVAAAAGG